MNNKRLTTQILLGAVLVLLLLLAGPVTAQDPGVVIIGGNSIYHGGYLPIDISGFTFTQMAPGTVSSASLAAFDIAVLNVGSYQMACTTNTLSSTQKSDLVDFVAGGKKLIIYDSECVPGPDYSWLPFPFKTANPGAQGAYGTLTIVEENTLSSAISTDPYYIDAAHLGSNTDAVGDMNVMTTYDPNWCLDMSGTNVLQVTGPVHTYAKYPAGTDMGLVIYNGLDLDQMSNYNYGNQLRKIWAQELQQPVNPSNLPCGFTVVGITLEPATAGPNCVGDEHTVMATLTDLLGSPQEGIEVTFTVTVGPNAGVSGTCAANADCTSDANGEVSFTYTGDGGDGLDEIKACFINEAGEEVCSQPVSKKWEVCTIPVAFDVKPGSCPNPFNVTKKGVLPVALVGTEMFDVTQVDPGTIRLTTNPATVEGVMPLRWKLEDAALPYERYLDKVLDRFSCLEYGDDQLDGYLDLTLKFSGPEVAAMIGPSTDGTVMPLYLTGNLFAEYGGTEILGEDIVWLLVN